MITKFRHMKVCKNCYQSFFSVRSNKMYCNRACRQAAYRTRKKKGDGDVLRIGRQGWMVNGRVVLEKGL